MLLQKGVETFQGTFADVFWVFFFNFLVPPQFTKVPNGEIAVSKGSTATAVCQAFGFPSPVIHWSRAFSPLPQGRSGVINGTLKISRFSPRDTGSYQCKAINRLGSVSTTTMLYSRRGKSRSIMKRSKTDSM